MTEQLSEWQQFQTGNGTRCIGGSSYAFYARQTASDKLLVFFQGGGACVDGTPFDDLKTQQLFDPSVVIPEDNRTFSSAIWDDDNPAHMGGLLDVDDERNPCGDYNMVFIPYCSADLHLGNAVHNGLHHKGHRNVMAVIDWIRQHFTTPQCIVVAGSSAGAIATPFYAGLLAEYYPTAAMTVLGDSAGGYGLTPTLTASLQNWGALEVMLNTPGYTHLSAHALSLSTAWLVNAKRFPHITFAQFNTRHDKAQQQFLAMLNTAGRVAEQLQKNLAALHANADNFYSYTVDDSYHTLLARPDFYTVSVDGEVFHQWVSALVNGDRPETPFNRLRFRQIPALPQSRQ